MPKKKHVGGLVLDGQILHGQTDLTLDKEGLAKAHELKAFFLEEGANEVIEHAFQPYANEADSLSVAGFTVENRLDRIALYGQVRAGSHRDIETINFMYNLLRMIVSEMERREPLPEKVATVATDTTPNPF